MDAEVFFSVSVCESKPKEEHSAASRLDNLLLEIEWLYMDDDAKVVDAYISEISYEDVVMLKDWWKSLAPIDKYYYKAIKWFLDVYYKNK